jgi:hypothetical protein
MWIWIDQWLDLNIIATTQTPEPPPDYRTVNCIPQTPISSRLTQHRFFLNYKIRGKITIQGKAIESET